MSDPVLIFDDVSKKYRLGKISRNTLKNDFREWYFKNFRSRSKIYNNGISEDLNSQYVWALKNISFELEAGSVLGVIGRNGAGKSTLLKILSRITAPTLGEIRIKGKIASLLEVGTGFHPELTGRENIFLNGAILGMKKKEIVLKLEEIIEFSGVQKYIDTPVKRYSSGMYVRLAFAVAAHLEPDIMIVDEVLAVGDADFQNKCLGKMGEISKKHGRTVLFVSHNMASIQALCNNVILLQNGKLLNIGSTQPMIEQYMSLGGSDAMLPISKRTDRTGEGSVRIQNISFLHSKNNQKLERILSGTPVTLKIDYISENPKAIDDLRIAIAFSHPGGGERFVVDNYYAGVSYSSIKNEGSVYCQIEKWPLNQGEYNYRYMVSNKGVEIDRLQNAGKVYVEFGDFYGNGVSIPQHLNGVFIEQKWY